MKERGHPAALFSLQKKSCIFGRKKKQMAHPLNEFSGSAGDFIKAMEAAHVSAPDAKAAAEKVAAAPPSKIICDDPSCTHDHSHDNEHSHKDAATAPDLSPPPPPALGEVGGVECVDATVSSLTLAWAHVPNSIKYELEWRRVEESQDETKWEKLGSRGFKTALPPKQKNKLSAGTAYEFRVRGRDPVDWFPWSPVRRHATLTSTTKRLAAVILSKAEEGALTVTWTKPDATDLPRGCTSVASYELQIREAQESSWTTVSTSLKGNAARKRNLSTDGKYTFRVRPSTFEGDAGGGAEKWYFSPPNATEFQPMPPTHSFFGEIFGQKLLCPGGGSSCGLERLAGKVIGVYFSASWCGPCRQFTPMLAQIYAQAVQAGRKFEVVFVSADKDPASFMEYFKGHMPWLAVPYDAPQRQAIQARFQVNGIPHLKIFNAAGMLVDENAVQSRSLCLENIAAWERNQTGNVATSASYGSSGGCCGGGACH